MIGDGILICSLQISLFYTFKNPEGKTIKITNLNKNFKMWKKGGNIFYNKVCKFFSLNRVNSEKRLTNKSHEMKYKKKTTKIRAPHPTQSGSRLMIYKLPALLLYPLNATLYTYLTIGNTFWNEIVFIKQNIFWSIRSMYICLIHQILPLTYFWFNVYFTHMKLYIMIMAGFTKTFNPSRII